MDHSGSLLLAQLEEARKEKIKIDDSEEEKKEDVHETLISVIEELKDIKPDLTPEERSRKNKE